MSSRRQEASDAGSQGDPESADSRRTGHEEDSSILFNRQVKSLERDLEDMLQKFNADRYAEIERRRAERKGSKALKKCRRDQRKYPRVPAQAHLVIMAPDGTVRVSMSKELEEHPQVKRATELLATSLEQWVEGQGTRGPVS